MAHTCTICVSAVQQIRYIDLMLDECWASVVGINNPQSTELRKLNFQPLEVVSRYRDQQLRVTKNVC